MSKYKLQFKLKQHTPIIHFQHDQHGATLRASELKPKLDKFLIEKFTTNNIDYSNFLIDGQEKALDYKVNIVAKNIETIEIKANKKFKVPSYFANMGDDFKPVGLSISDEIIILNIICFNNALLENISNSIESFFLETNFGTRQSKGFGSFTIDDRAFNNDMFDVVFDLKDSNNFLWSNGNELFKDNWKQYINLFGNLEIFYKSLRSGINRKGRNGTEFYIKPAIFHYAEEKLKLQWDKKSIKQFYIDNNKKQNLPLIKDLFGLSSLENWISYNVSVTKENSTIERFKSPLLFKPIKTENGFKVGIKSFEIDTDFLNKEFNIQFRRKKGLKLTTLSEFSWDSFWDYYKNELIKNEDRISEEYIGKPEGVIISNIHESINNKK